LSPIPLSPFKRIIFMAYGENILDIYNRYMSTYF
jgi:hypothetical protein